MMASIQGTGDRGISFRRVLPDTIKFIPFGDHRHVKQSSGEVIVLKIEGLRYLV
jgi:hypothetical protein